MSLISQDLWGSSKSISDMISRPEILIDDYLETFATESIVNGYERYSNLDKDSEEFSKSLWTKSLW